MPILDVTPVLIVPDVTAAVDFYVKTLGFALGNMDGGWAVVERDGVEVMFALPNPHMAFERSVMTGYLYFRTEEVDAVWEQLKDAAEVIYSVEDFYYGMREFAVRDLNGYILQFGQEIEEGAGGRA